MRCHQHHRNNSGQGLVEAAAILVITTAVTVAAILVMMGTGQYLYYKIKLASIAEAAAEYAADNRFWLSATRPNYSAANTRTLTTTMVRSLLQQEEFPATLPVVVTVDEGSSSVCTVQLQINNLRLTAAGPLARTVRIVETATQPYPNDPPIGLLGMSFCAPSSPCRGMYFPVFGAGTNTPPPSSFPAGNFPYWAGGAMAKGDIPAPTQSVQLGPPFTGY